MGYSRLFSEDSLVKMAGSFTDEYQDHRHHAKIYRTLPRCLHACGEFHQHQEGYRSEPLSLFRSCSMCFLFHYPFSLPFTMSHLFFSSYFYSLFDDSICTRSLFLHFPFSSIILRYSFSFSLWFIFSGVLSSLPFNLVSTQAVS